MILVERHIIKQNNKHYKELDNLCFLSKNLYNSALYSIRQYYFQNKKYLNKFQLINEFTKNNQVDYIQLPRKVSQQVIYQVDQNFKSFFNSLKSNNIKHKVSLPKYLNKQGRYCLVYTNQAVSYKQLKNNVLQLSGLKTFTLKIKHNAVKQVRISHKGYYIVIEVLYEEKEIPIKENNNRYASIDLGINNLATVASNIITPIIINGRPLKSINNFYNKKLALYKSQQDNNKHTKDFNKNNIYKLTLKRNNKIKDYLHKSSKYIVNHLVSNNINTLIIGLNKNWKQETNIGKRNNQKFVQIPHSYFISLLRYKCQLKGITVIIREESYTSKCSFIDKEDICNHCNYLGTRLKRGLFKTNNGLLINADINGSLNILRKEVSNAFTDERYEIQVYSMPSVFTVKL